MHDTTSLCANGPRCRNQHPHTQQPATTTGGSPWCSTCLDRPARDIRNLTVDYLDLAQLHEASLSQALHDRTTGSHESPLLIAGHIEALQAEIVHVATTWEQEVRAAARLATPEQRAPVAAWHTTITRPTPVGAGRPGHQVQRAATLLAAHIHTLAALPATTVYPTGCEDQPTDYTGADAIEHLQALHQRARAMLGRTRRTRRLPGTCPDCHADLNQQEPLHPDDDCPVYCANQCGMQWTYTQYEQWMTAFLPTPSRGGHR
ncbi:hypothetical protein [Micromonospora tulbaghiae]|uniref:hypothetical protein n=1 Tax=Micromonospora tulbaghiae TaxID=479978 RepID=UPI0033DFAE02